MFLKGNLPSQLKTMKYLKFASLRIHKVDFRMVSDDFKLVNLGHAGTDMDRSVQLTLRHGVEAKNYDDVSCLA